MINRDIETGYGTITKSSMNDNSLTIEAKAIYAYLCSYAGGKDVAFPSIKKMCFDLNVSEARLRKHFNLLIDYEYVEKHQARYRESKKWANNTYRILK